MRKLMTVLLVVAALLAIGELFADNLAEDMIEKRLDETTGARATADVSSFPLVTSTLLTERVRSVQITLTDLSTDEVEVDEITVDAEGIRLPRGRLFDGDLRPTAIDGGTVSAFLSVASLSENLGVPLGDLDPAEVSVELAGGTLTLEDPRSGAQSVPFPEELLPCSATGRVTSDGVRLRCSVDALPKIVLEQLPD